jgi:hypothetical protein
MLTPAEIASPALKIRFLQAAKEGKVDIVKKFVEDGVPLDVTDVCFLFIRFFLYLLWLFSTSLGLSTWSGRSYQLLDIQWCCS